MYPDQFEYYKAESVDEALDLMAEHGDRETELLAGGHSLLPTMKSGLASPDVLIDIGEIDALNGVEQNGDAVSIGATTRYADVAADDRLHGSATAFAEAAEAIGDIQVRNRGTVGGNVAHADPASDLPAAVVASDATIHVQGAGGSREIAADDFFLGMYATDVGEGELLTSIDVPTQDDGDVGAYAKKPSPSSGYAMVGVAAVLQTDGRDIDSARVAANGAMDHPTRLEGVEDALAGSNVADAPEAAEHATEGVEEWEFMDDLQASAEYRAQLLEVYTRRALEAAADRA